MKPKPTIDIVNVILEDCIEAYPLSAFIISLYKQYIARGSLSKKQLQGLYGKASAIDGIPPGKLAALESIIKKMPTRFKSEKPEIKPLYEKNEEASTLVASILASFPDHKRVNFLKSKLENNVPLQPAEMDDLRKIAQAVAKKQKG